MPTNKKVLVNGQPQPPKRKVKLARDVDWQEIVRGKHRAAARKKKP